jgi:glycosyltransferase involved in cell wall biosynthesis
LAKTGDSAELCSAILEMLGNDAKRAEMSANCRRIALAEYDLSVQTSRYVELYTDMLRHEGGGPVNKAPVHRAAASK